MKKILYTMLCALTLTFGACELDMYPHSQVSTSNLTDDDVNTMLTEVYSVMQNRIGVNGYILFDVFGGNFIRGGASGSAEYLTMINDFMTPSNGTLLAQWQAFYTTLYQVNELIIAAEKLPDSGNKTEVLGQAHFFRGLIYYNLVTRWGGVPIVLTPTQEKLARDTEEATWAFVEQELNLAIGMCPAFSSRFYASSSAATALMARAKLAQGKTGDAKTLAESLIADSRFALADFDQIFRGKDNKEVIFSYVNLLEESSVNLSALFYTRAHEGGGSYQYAPSGEVMSGLFVQGDKRMAISIDTYSGNNVINKYPSGESGRDPIVIARLGEMYLVSAEAQGYTDGMARLNELRAFRGLGNATATATTFKSVILEERRRELLAEGFRWYDCVRMGVAESEIGINAARTKFPIPEREMSLNPMLEPNPGYE